MQSLGLPRRRVVGSCFLFFVFLFSFIILQCLSRRDVYESQHVDGRLIGTKAAGESE